MTALDRLGLRHKRQRAVLDILAANPGRQYTEAELVELSGMSAGAVLATLRQLAHKGHVDSGIRADNTHQLGEPWWQHKGAP